MKIDSIAHDGIHFLRHAQHHESPAQCSLAWSDIIKIIVFKRDLFTYDLICLHFITPDQTIEIDEEDQHWKQLTESIPSYLPGALPSCDWFSHVAFPAFATNERTIYEKP